MWTVISVPGPALFAGTAPGKGAAERKAAISIQSPRVSQDGYYRTIKNLSYIVREILGLEL